jgi:hypothetical protein
MRAEKLTTDQITAGVCAFCLPSEFFFDGVVVEPGDGAQPPGHGGAGAAPGFQVAGEAFDVGAAGGEQVQGARAAQVVNWRRSRA